MTALRDLPVVQNVAALRSLLPPLISLQEPHLFILPRINLRLDPSIPLMDPPLQ